MGAMQSPPKQRSATPTVGSGDRADVLRDTLALYQRHCYADDRSEVVAARQKLAELGRERQALMPPAKRIEHITAKMREAREEMEKRRLAVLAADKEVRRFQDKLQAEQAAVEELEETLQGLDEDLIQAERALPPDQVPLRARKQPMRSRDEADDELDMFFGRLESMLQHQYSDAMDDSAESFLRDLVKEQSARVHDFCGRMDTNIAEQRHREKKRASRQSEDDKVDDDDDAAGWQQAPQRRRGTSSAAGRPRASEDELGSSPRRAPGTPQEPPRAASGSLASGGPSSGAERPNRGGWLEQVIIYRTLR